MFPRRPRARTVTMYEKYEVRYGARILDLVPYVESSRCEPRPILLRSQGDIGVKKGEVWEPGGPNRRRGGRGLMNYRYLKVTCYRRNYLKVTCYRRRSRFQY